MKHPVVKVIIESRTDVEDIEELAHKLGTHIVSKITDSVRELGMNGVADILVQHFQIPTIKYLTDEISTFLGLEEDEGQG